MDRLTATCPHATLVTHGPDVGLPKGQMGNSEVGHTNIGAGRVVAMDLGQIDLAIEEGSFFENPGILSFAERVREGGGTAHLFGLVSDGGVHGTLAHVLAAARALDGAGLPVAVHAVTETGATPRRAAGGGSSRRWRQACPKGARIATVIGRYLGHGPRQALGPRGARLARDRAGRGRRLRDRRRRDRGRLRRRHDRRVRRASRDRGLWGPRRGRRPVLPSTSAPTARARSPPRWAIRASTPSRACAHRWRRCWAWPTTRRTTPAGWRRPIPSRAWATRWAPGSPRGACDSSGWRRPRSIRTSRSSSTAAARRRRPARTAPCRHRPRSPPTTSSPGCRPPP